ncbi:hypothetical protein B0H17DRAFT_1134360 [Mycena rosella]|uniref:Uncharacterized protein n=1 Tax=Mycena rosella TaxID=1033263 RepID=A0AAD7DIE9_MYCRO|nr:hypothetical protein B0H17DRAFT_1134360 [Mycena rosella]
MTKCVGRAMLAIAICVALLYIYHLECPSTQLSRLEHVTVTEKAEEIVRDTKLHCPRDILNLAQEGMCLSRVRRSASKIRTCLIETESFTWKEYHLFSCDISDCTKNVKQIRTAVQLIVEAERQRKYTEDINEIEVILIRLREDNQTAFPPFWDSVDLNKRSS